MILVERFTRSPSSVESNSAEWSFNTRFGYTTHPIPLPPLTFNVGVVI